MGMNGAKKEMVLRLRDTLNRLCEAAKKEGDWVKLVPTTCATTGQERYTIVIVTQTSANRWVHEPVGHLVEHPMSEYARPVWANKPGVAA